MAVSLCSSHDEKTQGAVCAPEGEETVLISDDQDGQDSLKKCIASNEMKPRASLIRFVMSPDKIIIPDIAEKLPGRGLWVSADCQLLSKAIEKNLFKRAAKTAVTVPDDLYAQTKNGLRRRVLDLLGLARSANLLVMGQEMVQEAWGRGQVKAILIAHDAGGDGPKKLSRTDFIETVFNRGELGAAIGKDHVVYLGLRPNKLTSNICTNCERLNAISKPQE